MTLSSSLLHMHRYCCGASSAHQDAHSWPGAQELDLQSCMGILRVTDCDTAMQVDGVQASIILDDFFDVGESMLKSNPEVIKLCSDFGIPSMDHVAIDPWPSALQFRVFNLSSLRITCEENL